MKKTKKPLSVTCASPGDSPTPGRVKRDQLFLFGILLLALILRVVALLDFGHSVYNDFLLWDERIYHTWAENIAMGSYHSTMVYEFAPLPAYLMAIIYKVFSPNTLYIRIFHVGLGVLTCYVVYLIGKEIADRVVGLLACLIAAIYKPFIFYSIVLLNTTLSVLLFGLTVYLLLCILNRHSMVKAILLGIAIGLTLNVRPNSLALIPFLGFFILWNIYRGRSSLRAMASTFSLFLAGFCLAISPFAVRNYIVSGEVALTTSQAGYNLYIGNNLDNPVPYYRPVPFASSSPFEQSIQFTIEASRRAGKKLTSQEASYYWTGAVIKQAADRTVPFLRKTIQKTLAFLNCFEAGDHYHIGFMSGFVGFFKIPFLGLCLILPLGTAGLLLEMGRGSRKDLALGSLFFSYAATLILFFTSTRHRLPLLVILIPFAVMGMRELFSCAKMRQWKRVFTYSGIAIALFVIEFLPVQGTGDMTAYYNTHAIILDSKGRENEALQYWEASSKMERPYSAFANLSLAGKALGRRDIRKALGYLDQIPDASFAAAYKYDLLGDVMMAQGQIDRAIAAYERSLDINSGQRGPRHKLVKLYWRVDREKALREFETLEYISSFYDFLEPPAFGGGSRNRNDSVTGG